MRSSIGRLQSMRFQFPGDGTTCKQTLQVIEWIGLRAKSVKKVIFMLILYFEVSHIKESLPDYQSNKGRWRKQSLLKGSNSKKYMIINNLKPTNKSFLEDRRNFEKVLKRFDMKSHIARSDTILSARLLNIE